MSEPFIDDQGRAQIRLLSEYTPGTTLRHAEGIIDFDRRLRMLVMDGVERIEVAIRMRIGYVLGRRSPFAYEDPACFTEIFTAESTDPREPAPNRHVRWLQRVNERKASSDERFVEHFRDMYDARMPVWALTEILELGHLSVLYRGMNQQDAEEIALAFEVPTKKIMTSWLASLNFVRNVAAHHSRLFNRKLQHAPARPKVGQVPILDHLRDAQTLHLGVAALGRLSKDLAPGIFYLSGGADRQDGMDSEPAHRNPPSSQKPLVGHRPVDRTTGKKVHASHRTRQVKIRGLIMDLPGAEEPVEVCVNDQAGWELIYKNPAVHVKCVVSSCDTLLTAKRMSASGLRFLAIRSGGCDHNLVEMQVKTDEIAQDPATLDGGGGPEGVEHLWIKGRLYTIARKLGAEAVVEHSPTHGDVFLPEHGLVLEYQRWNTDFATRTMQRTTAGAARTIWLFPTQLPKEAPVSLSKTIRKEVLQNGGVYVSVLNPSSNYEPQRPWEDPSQERTARLFASGSIAEFDPDRQALIYKSRSLATILAEILKGERVLRQAPIWKKSLRRLEMARVWVLLSDLELSRDAQSRRRSISRPASNHYTASEHSDEPHPEQAVRPEVEPTPGPHNPQSHSDERRSTAADDHSPLTKNLANTDAEQIADLDAVPNVDSTASTVSKSENQDVTTKLPAPARSLWKRFVDWLRQT